MAARFKKGIVMALGVLLMFSGCGAGIEEAPNISINTDAPPLRVERRYTVRLSFNTLFLKPGGEQRVGFAVYNENGEPTSDGDVVFTAQGCISAEQNGRIIANGIGEGSVLVNVFGAEGGLLARGGISVTVTDSAEFYGGATYINGVLLVNKEFSIPESYDPGSLLPETQVAAEAMIAEAARQGHDLWIQSGYRPYAYQAALYEKYISEYGLERAEKFSAQPGHSEHQTGYTFDLNTITEAFGYTPAGMWVAEHAHEYGFIVRYPKGKENITGYTWEPWHLRYLGVETATAVYESGLTLEEFLGVKTIFEYDF